MSINGQPWDARLPNDIVYELNNLSRRSTVLAELAHAGFVQELEELIKQVKQSESNQEKKDAEKMLNDFLKEKAKQDQNKQDQNKQDQKKQDSTKNDDGDDGDDAGNDGDDAGSDGDDAGNDGDDAGSDGDDAGNDGDDAGNDGDDAGNDGDAEKDGDDAGNDGDAEKDGTDGDAEKDGTDGKDGRKSKENAQNSKKPSNNQTTPADQDSSNFGDIDLDAAIEMLQNLLEEMQQNPDQSKQDSELSDFQKKMLSNAMRTNPKTQATLEKMAILQNLDKNDMISDLPEAFKKLLWSVPKMLGVFKDVIDGFKRGRPSATFGEKILQTRGKLVRPRTSKIAQDFDLYPSLALLDIAKNNTHVYRAEQASGEGEFVLAVDLSGSMMNHFDQQYTFSFFDLAKTIAMCLYSVKKTNIVGWGDQSIIFPSQQHFAMASAHQSDTLIRTCYHAIAQLFETKRIAHKLQKGTDVVILTDGLPKEKESNMGEAIKTLVTQNKGVVWLFDLVGERNDRDEQIPEGWAAMADHYVRIKTLDDVKNIESVMRKSLRKK